MRIGLGFHWERTISALLPGSVSVNDDPLFRLVNEVPLETYLECVVGSEMNPASPADFLKTHAVISRSWAVGKILGCHDHSDAGKVSRGDLILTWEDTCDHRGFHVCSDDHCQRYQGLQPIPDSVRDAIRDTAGEVLISPAGRLVDARFSKCCGGRTEVFSTCWQDREEDCLESVDDPWCDLSALAPEDRRHVLGSVLKDYDLANGGGYAWDAEVTAAEVRENLRIRFGIDLGDIRDLEIVHRGPSGRADRMLITGTLSSIEVGKELTIRRLLAADCLYSSNFVITKSETPDGPRFRLEGRGWGHGVGLCQIGAARMALAGHPYRRILAHYYPRATVLPLPEKTM